MENFFNYPLCLLQLIKNDNDKGGLIKIISFAMMNFSERVGYQTDNIAKQIIYLYYRRPYFLTKSVQDRLNLLFDEGIINEDEDYHGFAGDTFFPETEASELIPVLLENQELYKECLEIYTQHQAISILNLNPALITDIRYHYPIVKKFVESFEKTNGPDAWASVSNKIIFDCFNGTLSMDHFRLISSVKSVLGKRNLNLTYKSVLLSRMFGCKKMQLLLDIVKKNPGVQSKYIFLNRRRQWEKLIYTAMAQNHISYFCTGRQFFVSVTMSGTELQTAVTQRKQNFGKVSISA
jgi:hypothetical protein